jgi:hypothetical protein
MMYDPTRNQDRFPAHIALGAHTDETSYPREFRPEGAEGSSRLCPCSPHRTAAASASPELSARPRRRTFTARDKLRILAETDRGGPMKAKATAFLLDRVSLA